MPASLAFVTAPAMALESTASMTRTSTLSLIIASAWVFCLAASPAALA